MKKTLAALCVVFLGGIVVWKALNQSISWQIQRLKDRSWEVRRRAAETLWRHGSEAREAIPALLEALRKEEDTSASCEMALALGRMGPSSVPTLIDILMKTSSDTVRRYTAVALSEIGPDARAAVPVLVLLDAMKIGHSSLDGRYGAAASKICGDKDATLIELLKDPDVQTRLLAAKALATRAAVSSVQRAAVPVLIEALKDSDAGVRQQAAITLGLYRQAAITREFYDFDPALAVPALQQAQDADPDPAVRQSAAEALTKIH